MINEITEYNFSTPVVFITYIRLDTTKKAFEPIKKAKPPIIYHISDAADDVEKQIRVEEVRKYVRENIDWPCELVCNYADSNMGCKNRIISGLDWVFKQTDKAIIIEDDVIVSQSFFRFAQEMLERYCDDKEVMMVTSGSGVSGYQSNNSYWFSKNCSIWGWATWRRAWELNDAELSRWPEVKKTRYLHEFYDDRIAFKLEREIERVYLGELNTWDYGWQLAKAINKGLEVVPKVNLMENVGITSADATHVNNNTYDIHCGEIEFPLIHPNKVEVECEYEKKYADIWYKTSSLELWIRKIVPADWLKKIREFFTKL